MHVAPARDIGQELDDPLFIINQPRQANADTPDLSLA